MRFSTAGYFKDLLTTCLDMDVVYKDAATATSKKKSLVEQNSAKGSSLTVLPDACDKTFSDRKPLATCTEDMKPGQIVESGKTIHRYYLFEFLRGDGSMRECIKDGGKWESVSHDSPEYEKAQTEAELRKNDEEMKRLESRLPH